MPSRVRTMYKVLHEDTGSQHGQNEEHSTAREKRRPVAQQGFQSGGRSWLTHRQSPPLPHAPFPDSIFHGARSWARG